MIARIITQTGVLVGSIKSSGTLTGSIQSKGVLIGAVKSKGALVGSLSKPVGYDDYVGSYSVTPQVEPQIISTADKRLAKDIVIETIPVYEVSNPEGGTTVTIG